MAAAPQCSAKRRQTNQNQPIDLEFLSLGWNEMESNKEMEWPHQLELNSKRINEINLNLNEADWWRPSGIQWMEWVVWLFGGLWAAQRPVLRKEKDKQQHHSMNECSWKQRKWVKWVDWTWMNLSLLNGMKWNETKQIMNSINEWNGADGSGSGQPNGQRNLLKLIEEWN